MGIEPWKVVVALPDGLPIFVCMCIEGGEGLFRLKASIKGRRGPCPICNYNQIFVLQRKITKKKMESTVGRAPPVIIPWYLSYNRRRSRKKIGMYSGPCPICNYTLIFALQPKIMKNKMECTVGLAQSVTIPLYLPYNQRSRKKTKWSVQRAMPHL